MRGLFCMLASTARCCSSSISEGNHLMLTHNALSCPPEITYVTQTRSPMVYYSSSRPPQPRHGCESKPSILTTDESKCQLA
ncbi:uncharacterized protein SCHCODRAFT_02190026 [Schizophyllum commune H4-8]|uniref:uncharacterized protein n=1 Tax=Schizophyllum commune (strain H4-8 / FGSC 9210) TaxID=578458 RepID=UPI00215E2C3B|nr:uncharacterized protein SCHCODRAFT_02190026 [Schizophyllum commune H4-8]KAI5896383.1 hypothetical protein SCHCODRAFT_02190026 [Schizophyllum commune H4-8]